MHARFAADSALMFEWARREGDRPAQFASRHVGCTHPGRGMAWLCGGKLGVEGALVRRSDGNGSPSFSVCWWRAGLRRLPRCSSTLGLGHGRRLHSSAASLDAVLRSGPLRSRCPCSAAEGGGIVLGALRCSPSTRGGASDSAGPSSLGVACHRRVAFMDVTRLVRPDPPAAVGENEKGLSERRPDRDVRLEPDQAWGTSLSSRAACLAGVVGYIAAIFYSQRRLRPFDDLVGHDQTGHGTPRIALFTHRR